MNSISTGMCSSPALVSSKSERSSRSRFSDRRFIFGVARPPADGTCSRAEPLRITLGEGFTRTSLSLAAHDQENYKIGKHTLSHYERSESKLGRKSDKAATRKWSVVEMTGRDCRD